MNKFILKSCIFCSVEPADPYYEFNGKYLCALCASSVCKKVEERMKRLSLKLNNIKESE